MSETNISQAEIESIISKYLKCFKNSDGRVSEDQLKAAEEKILLRGAELSKQQNITELRDLFVITRPFFEVLGKAKASKLVRSLVEFCLAVDQSNTEKVSLCLEYIEWAREHHRMFLRRTLEARLVKLYNEIGKHTEAMKLCVDLAKELRKLDDRELLIEVTLEESRAGFALNNYSKAKTALVLARTSANGAYTSANMQAAIDLQSGILYAADEKDFKTAYSYFYEAFEGFVNLGEKPAAIKALKYLCMCKIMLNETDIRALLDSKLCLPYATAVDILAIRELAAAFKERSLDKFQKCLEKYKKELQEDNVVKVHSNTLHENMLEKEISRVIEPYSQVDITYICKRIHLPKERIEKKLATMLLDQKFRGVIDQSECCLTLYPPEKKDKTYEKAVELMKSLNKAVDGCYLKCQKVYAK